MNKKRINEPKIFGSSLKLTPFEHMIKYGNSGKSGSKIDRFYFNHNFKVKGFLSCMLDLLKLKYMKLGLPPKPEYIKKF